MESITIAVPPSDEPQVVRVCVCDVRGGRARIGCEADRDVKIVRTELLGLAGSPRPPAAEAANGEGAAVCSVCRKPLAPAPARFDGEPTFVGCLLCPEHPEADVLYERVTEVA